MADKLVEIKATEHVGRIVDDEKLVSQPTVREYIATTPQQEYSTNTQYTNLNIQYSGFGEDAIPNDGLFRRNFDLTDLSDAISLNTSRSLQSITQGFSELLKYNIGKVLQDSTNPVDSISFQLDYVRQLNELVDATDDILGEANIDDDQTARFIKVSNEILRNVDLSFRNIQLLKIDNFSYSDLINFNIGVNKQETSNIEDYPFNRVRKFNLDVTFLSTDYKMSVKPVKLESLTISESNTKVSTKPFFEAETASDEFRLAPYKNNSESLSMTDLASFLVAYSRQITDTQLTSEALSFNLSIKLNDSINAIDLLIPSRLLEEIQSDSSSTNEELIYNVAKQLQELINPTDDVFGEANVDDDQYANIAKVLVDLPTTSDLLDRIVNYFRTLIDLSTITEVISSAVSILRSDVATISDLQISSTNKQNNEVLNTSQTLSLAIQNYFLEDYVSPGYVGNIYTY